MKVVHPFSNGTEERAWMSTWCDYCANDHGMHFDDDTDRACHLILNNLVKEYGEVVNEEAWIAEPDDGRFFLPSRMVCLAFTPCTEAPCEGDPGAEDRAQRVAEVQKYWRSKL